MSYDCGDPYGGIGCPVPGCTHDPKGWPESAEMDQPDPTAAAVRAAQAEALYAARDALYRGEGPDLVADSDIVYGEWLGNRADRLATDTAAPEGFVDGSDFIDSLADSLAAPVAVEGVETVEWGVRFGPGDYGVRWNPSYGSGVYEPYTEAEARADSARTGYPLVRRTRVEFEDRVSEWTPVEPETSEPEGGDERG